MESSRICEPQNSKVISDSHKMQKRYIDVNQLNLDSFNTSLENNLINHESTQQDTNGLSSYNELCFPPEYDENQIYISKNNLNSKPLKKVDYQKLTKHDLITLLKMST